MSSLTVVANLTRTKFASIVWRPPGAMRALNENRSNITGVLAVAERVCPFCDEVTGDIVCPRCGRSLPQKETHVTSETPAAMPEPIEKRREPSMGNYASWDEFRLTSPAIERERMTLAMRPVPDLRGVIVLPLPENVPAAMDSWGRPLATLSVPGVSPIFLWIGVTALFGLGSLFTLGGLAYFAARIFG